MDRLRRLLSRSPRHSASLAAWRWRYGRGPRLASSLRRRWVLFTHPHADITIEEPVYLGPGFSVHAPFGGTLHIAAGTDLRRDFRVELGPQARVTIGEGSVFTYGAVLQCSTSIDIGRGCQFGQSTLIVDGNHRYRDLDRPMLAQGYDFRPITIADEATVLTKCTILADLGRRCMVAAHAVVTRPVPDYTLVGGVPARELEYYGPAREESAHP